MKLTTIVMMLVCTMVIGINARADNPQGSPASTGIHLLNFRVNQLSVFQGSFGNTYTGQLSWDPSYWFTDQIGLVINVGGSLFNGPSSTTFGVLDYEGMIAFAFKSWIIEAGGGAQTWFTSPSTTAGIIGGNVHYKFDPKLFKFIDSIFVGYSALFQSSYSQLFPSTVASQIRAGVQVAF